MPNRNEILFKTKKMIETTGQVVEVLANGQFKVEIDSEGKKVVLRCYLNGKMRQNQIKVIIGDNVNLEIPTGIHLINSIGRITYRNK